MIDERILDNAEARLGVALPVALKEWFFLAGHRFCDVNQDRPQRAEELALHDGRVMLWQENQGEWWLGAVVPCAEDEPWVEVIVDEGDNAPERARLSDAMLGMVYSDTFVGVWSGLSVGPLGALSPEVTGGFVERPPQVDVAIHQLPPLTVFKNPFFPTPFRGDDALVFREHGGGTWEWMAATRAAAAKAHSLLEQ